MPYAVANATTAILFLAPIRKVQVVVEQPTVGERNSEEFAGMTERQILSNF